MSFVNFVGKTFVSRGEALLMKGYVKQYGHQIGKVSRNGHKAFSRIENGKEVITGLDRQGNVISKITRDVTGFRNNVGRGTVHTERFRDGALKSVTDVSLASNFRDTFTHYSDGSAFRQTLFKPAENIWQLNTTAIPSVYAKNGVPDIRTTTKTFNV